MSSVPPAFPTIRNAYRKEVFLLRRNPLIEGFGTGEHCTGSAFETVNPLTALTLVSIKLVFQGDRLPRPTAVNHVARKLGGNFLQLGMYLRGV